MVATFAFLTVGAILSVTGSPILDQSGFRNVIVAINDDVPEENGSALIQSIKDLLTETSDMMYFASMTRFYIKEVTILTPKGWRLSEIAGEARHGEVYEHASIKIAQMDTEHGDAPYTHQPGRCGEEGEPILISDEYLINLMENTDEMIVKYGPIGKVLTHEFTKYRYGIFEEYGYPGSHKNGEVYPSVSTQAFLDRDGLWKMALVNNTCSDTKLEGKLLHIEGEKEQSHIVEGCDIDDETGEIISDSCFFSANLENNAVTSMGSYHYTDLVSVFCDDEYFPHNHDAQNKHNAMCLDETRDYEPMSTWTTILKHTDFDYGHNGGIYVDSTVPSFSVVRASNAKFVLVLDNSGSMTSCNRFTNLKTTMKRWVDNLKPFTKVAIVKFGSYNVCATGDHSITKGCYMEISDKNNGDAEKRELHIIIDAMSDMGATYMSEALQSAQQIMKDEHNANQGQPGIVMLVTDGMANGPGPAIDDVVIWKPFQMSGIRVITLNLGAEIDTRMMHLVTETGGRAFVSKSCAGIEDDAFQYASRTYIPNEVGDKAMQNQTTSKETVPGQHAMTCKNTNNGTNCFKHSFTIEKKLNKEVNVNMRLSKQGVEIVDAKEVVGELSVRKTLTNEKVAGFSPSFPGEYKNYVDFSHLGTVDDQDTEEILDVYLELATGQTPADLIRTTVQFETTAKRNFDGTEDADYYITCDHDPVMKANKEFKIVSRVLRGNTPVDHANVMARVSVSKASDPNGDTPPMFFQLLDDGSVGTNSGDEHENDGTYTTTISPSQIHADDGFGIAVMCNLVESPQGEWNDNNFYGKKKSLPTQSGQFTPYCCGTKDQKWNIPKTEDVTKLLRSSLETGAFLDPSLFVKDIDFGPPARIADLKAEMVGKPEEGLVKLTWTATGDDWGSGTAQSYNLVYSDKRKGLMRSNGITRDSRMLMGGSMEPLPAGEKMEVIIRLENHHVPGTFLFALNATDDAGKVSRPSNVARINFHDGSPLVLDADPHLVHGHARNDLPFEEKIRKIVKDERIVTRFMAHIEKNKKIVRDAENNVMEKRLKEKMGRRGTSVERIMEKIKKDEVLRAIYKSKLL